MATIRDVARESGVSVATVSYVLNNGPRPVRVQTRDRVLAAMRRLEYHPNAMARGLVSRRLHTIGVLFGQIESSIITNAYAAGVLQGVLSASADLGYNVTLFPKPWEDAETSAAPFKDRRTDGVIVVAPLTDSDMVTGLARLKLPLVVVSSTSPVSGVPAVDVDNEDGAYRAVDHLLSLGHRRIAHIGGDPRYASVATRQSGYERRLREAELPLRPEYLVYADYSGRETSEAVIKLLQLPEPPTAIFAGNDLIALTICDTVRSLSLSVPGDLSVIGFDDIPVAALVSPGLTTMRQPLAALGQRATHLLIQQINNDAPKRQGVDSSTPQLQEYLEATDLVVRGTTGPPR